MILPLSNTFFVIPIESCGSISGREGNCHEKNQTVGKLAQTEKKLIDVAVGKFYGSFFEQGLGEVVF